MDITLKARTDKGEEEIKGKLVNVKNSNEQWSEYELEDGTKVLVKHVLIKIIDTNQTNQDGTKVYATQFQPVFNILEKK